MSIEVIWLIILIVVTLIILGVATYGLILVNTVEYNYKGMKKLNRIFRKSLDKKDDLIIMALEERSKENGNES